MNHGRGINVKEKAEDFGASMKKLIAYCKPYMAAIIIAVILSGLSSILIIIGPDKLSEITNIITEGIRSGIPNGIDLDQIKNIGLTLMLIYAISLVFGYLQGFIMATITQKVSRSLREKISKKINRLPLKYFDNHSTGNILSTVTNDVDTIGQSLNQSLGSLVGAITLFVGSLVMMLKTNLTMTAAAVLSTFIGFALMAFIMKKSQKYFTMQQQQLGKLNGHIEETYTGHNVIKVYNATEEAINEYKTINDKLFDSAIKSRFLSGLMQPIMGFIGNFGYVAVCVTGAVLVMDNKISFGVIVAFMMYIRFFARPLAQMAQAFTALQSTAAASERVFKFLEQDEISNEENKTQILSKETVTGNIEFTNVKFGYKENKTIINDFSLKVNPGEKIAIVGPTGAGKTTLVNLLMRFYEIGSGSIKIDGIDTTDLTRENIHELFAMVLQDTWMFNGTIKENIVYNNKNLKDEEVIAACKTVGLDHFIKSLPKGYDTVLTDSETLSAGEKQLLTIARGMLEKSPLLILDEATSSVDTRTEVLVQEAMDKLTKGKTSFIIAHRLSTIKNADKILVLNEGDIVEQGTHTELIKKNGFYAELYNAQFEN
jgi:ATP-binding cassette subfamily B protein